MLEDACRHRRQRCCPLAEDGAGQARRVLAEIAYARAAVRYARAAVRPDRAAVLSCVPGIPL
jgi:hypothetical protein